MVLRMPVICCVCILGSLGCSIGAEPNHKEDRDRIEQMMAFLEAGEWNMQKAAEALDTLTALAPSDKEAQSVIVRYFERTGRGIEVPLCYARLLSRYGSDFAGVMTASLAKTQNNSVKQLWLATIAVMGDKAAGEAESLVKYLHEEPDPAARAFARIALATIGAGSVENSKVLEGEIHNRTRAGCAAVYVGAMVGFHGLASESFAEVKRWLTEDVSVDHRCVAAMALAVYDCRDESVERNVRALLEKAMKDPDGSARIVYAYALALLDARHADRYWRIILKKLGGNFNHTDNAALLSICDSIPGRHIDIIERLRKDPDPEVAAGAARIGRFVGQFLRSMDRSCVRIRVNVPHWGSDRSKGQVVLAFPIPRPGRARRFCLAL